jgi:penicillin-binding protein 1C
VLLPRLIFAILSLLFPFPQHELEAIRAAKLSTLVLDRDGAPLRAFTGKDDSWMFWTDLDHINPRLVQATIAAEDRRFYTHSGVDPLAVARASWSNLNHGRVVSGASTLTMQVIRLVENRPRTLPSKLVEGFRALQLEQLLTKRQVLEHYLNLAPYGGNAVGVEAASLRYFGKHASDLTLAEAALLAGLPQAPSRLRPDRRLALARERRDHVLRRMHACGYIPRGELAKALREPVVVRRDPLPCDALHLAILAQQRYPDQTVLTTTLDRRIQTLSEAAIREAVDRLRPAGVSNGAVVVIENHTGAVRAMIGSCDFFSEEDDGQVNGATAPRSPGSALKPFTYALAFDDGLCTPDTILADVPANYTGYEPENYDRDYRGPVPAREALAASLNIPAVRLLGQVGQRKLYTFLKDLGLTTLTREPGHYGLALTLGSVEVTLLELTNAYATLARLGIHRAYRLLETEPVAPGRRALSEGAAYLIADVLTDTTRLSGATLWQSDAAGARMAWKTGTSFGHRDAWTIAYTPEYTVGVWLGNFSGKPSRELVGVRAAAPVAARIMDRIHAGTRRAWYVPPPSVESRRLCAVSGMPLGDHCPHAAQGLFLRGRPPDRPCSVHVEVKMTSGSDLKIQNKQPPKPLATSLICTLRSDPERGDGRPPARVEARTIPNSRFPIPDCGPEGCEPQAAHPLSVPDSRRPKTDHPIPRRAPEPDGSGTESYAEAAEVAEKNHDLAEAANRKSQIAKKELVRLCPHCATGRDYAVRVMQSWPPELAAWLRQHGQGADLVPPHFPGCPRGAEDDAPPQILSPAASQSYVLVGDGPDREKLLLKATSRMDKLYWFIDGSLHGTTAPLEPSFWPLQRGPHTIVCSDPAGRSASVAIEVR